ncbi:hypothetical protein NIES2101_41895 [Calothrix sp. HK-06]|nr:hypothetical protein NIES2101_41895 [Calothrix sp. HK-06]
MTQNVSGNETQVQARIALYLAAKEAAEVLQSALAEADTQTKQNYDNQPDANFYSTGEKRIQLALEILKIAWSPK